MSWTLIESQVLSNSAASVTLGSGGTIPQTFKTLKVVMSVRSDANDGTNQPWSQCAIQLNGTGSTNRTGRGVFGTGAATGSTTLTDTTFWIAGNTATASTFGNAEITIPNYSGSTNKPISSDSVTESNGTYAAQFLIASLWSNTAAITSITVTPGGTTNLVSGSTFSLYGLR